MSKPARLVSQELEARNESVRTKEAVTEHDGVFRTRVALLDEAEHVHVTVVLELGRLGVLLVKHRSHVVQLRATWPRRV